MSNSFDRWQNDVFFSAAEEVQDSADVMESVYRTWMRDRRDGSRSDYSYELQRELQTALGTTKWQLEEFEKAIKSSHKNCFSDYTIARHKQFVAAIENQISLIESALKESITEEGGSALRWVQLDKEERDDLAVFLSGTPRSSQGMMDELIDLVPSEKNGLLGDGEVDVNNRKTDDSDCIEGFEEVVDIKNDDKCIVELAAKGITRTEEEINNQGERSNGSRRTSSLDLGAWKIVIADEDVQRKTLEAQPGKATRVLSLCGLLGSVEPGNKIKWFRSSFRKPKDIGILRCLDFRAPQRLTQGMDMFNRRSRGFFSNCHGDSKFYRVQQHFGWVGGLQRQLQSSHYHILFTRPLQITFVLMLTIFLLIPFVFYAN